MWEIVDKLMEQKGVKASEVSKATGIPQSVFTDWKKGRYTPKADKLYALARYFEVPMEVFFEPVEFESSKTYPHRMQPLYDVAGGAGRVNDTYAYRFFEDEDEEDCSWCEVHGNSMFPVLQDGDMAKVHHQTETTAHDISVVKIDGDEATCKYVEIAKDGIWLRAENKEVFEDRFYTIQEVLTKPISIIGKVVELKRRF